MFSLSVSFNFNLTLSRSSSDAAIGFTDLSLGDSFWNIIMNESPDKLDV